MARPVWKGAINFGLVNVPVELVTVVHEKTVHFHMLSKDGSCRLHRKLFCPDSGKEYDFNDTARGIEIAPEEYVLVQEKEIKRLRPESGKALEIEQFVDLEAIDPVFYDRVYYVRPADDSFKPYRLLVEAMKRGGKVALARFIMRQRQYLAAIRVLEDGLVLHTLHYADEVDPIDDAIPEQVEKAKVTAAELSIAEQLLKSMTRPLKIEQFRDEYREKLEQLIEAKKKGKEVVEIPDEGDEEPSKTTNLMAALKQSLEATRGGGSRTGASEVKSGSGKSNSSARAKTTRTPSHRGPAARLASQARKPRHTKRRAARAG